MSEKKLKNPLASYLKMEGHAGYYQNPISKKIKYVKTHNGEVVSIPCLTTKITEAKKIVDEELIRRFSANPKKDLLKKKGILTPDLTTCWKEVMDERAVTRDPNTMQGYDVSWRIGIEPFWGKLTVADISHKAMRDYEKWYLKNHPTRVFFNTGKHLAMLLRYVRMAGYADTTVEVPDLDRVIEARTQKEEVGRVYTDKEFQALLDNAFSEIVRVGILCYRYMGMRKNELLKSERKRWDFKKRTATLWSYKNKKWRTIVIPEIVAGPLEKFVKSCTESIYLFPAPTNPEKFMASQVFDEQWTKTKIAADIKDATAENAARIHDLRHTFATQTATDGWPPIVACYVLDMSLKEYQDTYTHVTEGDILKLMNKSFGGLK